MLFDEIRQGGVSGEAHASFDPSGKRVIISGAGNTAAVYTCRVCGDTKALLARAKQLEPYPRKP